MKRILFLLAALVMSMGSVWANYKVGSTPISTAEELVDGVYALSVRSNSYSGYLYYTEDTTPFRFNNGQTITAFCSNGIVTNEAYLWRIVNGDDGYSIQSVSSSEYISNLGQTDFGRHNIKKVGSEHNGTAAVAVTSFQLGASGNDNGITRWLMYKTQDGQLYNNAYPYLHTNGSGNQILSYWENGSIASMNSGSACKIAFYPVTEGNFEAPDNAYFELRKVYRMQLRKGGTPTNYNFYYNASSGKVETRNATDATAFVANRLFYFTKNGNYYNLRCIGAGEDKGFQVNSGNNSVGTMTTTPTDFELNTNNNGGFTLKHKDAVAHVNDISGQLGIWAYGTASQNDRGSMFTLTEITDADIEACSVEEAYKTAAKASKSAADVIELFKTTYTVSIQNAPAGAGIKYDGGETYADGATFRVFGFDQSKVTVVAVEGYTYSFTVNGNVIEVSYASLSSSVDVTYRYLLNGVELFSETITEYEGVAPTKRTFPEYVQATGYPEKIDKATTSYDIVTSYKESMPFKTDGTVYNIKFNANGARYWWVTNESNQAKEQPNNSGPAYATQNLYKWSIAGDWYNGFTFCNKSNGKYLTSPAADSHNVAATLEDAATELSKFELRKKSAGYYFAVKNGSTYLAHTSATTLNISLWNVENYGGNVVEFSVAANILQTLASVEEISNSKIYYIANERGGWAQKSGDHAIYQNESAYQGSGIAADNSSDYQRWAIIKGEKGYYIYNMGTQEWINANDNTAAALSKAVEITASGVAANPFYFNASGKYMAVTNWNAYGWKVFTYGDTNDAGNKFGVYEVEDLSTEMQNSLETAVYNFEHNFASKVAELAPYFEGGVFALTPAAKAELSAEYATLKGQETVTKTEYDAFKTKIDAAQKVPLTSGYYFLKSHNYPTRINTASVSGTHDKMTAQENVTSDLGTVATIMVKESGKITIHYQGLNVNTAGEGESVDLSGNEATEFTVVDLGGFAQIGIDGDDYGYLHCGNSRDYGFCTWTEYSDSPASSWDIIPAETIEVTLTDLSANRTAKEGEGDYWTTLYVPFNFTTSDATIYGAEQESSFLKVTSFTEAEKNSGYILNAEQATATLSIVQPAVETATSPSVLTGTFMDAAPVEGVSAYVFSCVEGELGFYKFGGDKLAANKAYFVPTEVAGVQGYILDFGGVTTGIKGLPAVAPAKASFDLQGRRVKANAKGLTIQNGVKVIR